MRMLGNYSGLLIIVSVLLFSTVQAEDTTHLGHDYARKELAKITKESTVQLVKDYKSLLALIKRSHSPGDDEHIAETANMLVNDQISWTSYRNTHCQLQANVYVFPSTSRMWGSQYNSCKLKMNKNRIKFFKNIHFEYK